ncbi:beta-L-arabinofuranosidase domain-containing protein [Aestuariivivens sediminis]|uniref:beta-L-arabinofuranosidase domain-containing protein n=1 Tax=Aestuariivivens sediminis TaxID=2913557 RepID=UPI001F5851B9|nr:beta-L-arabinofuranosidase domain-containing protein [Aestuariivivens sediminis]
MAHKRIYLSVVALLFFLLSFAQKKDVLFPLPSNSVHFEHIFEEAIQRSIENWIKGSVPYSALVDKFRTGRSFFAQGEMWGKAVRSGCMFYRYTQDPKLKNILDKTMKDMMSASRPNGSISCSTIENQPDGPGGDLWERKYVLLAMLQYYTNVQKDSTVLNSMIGQLDCIIDQVGYPPKTSILDLGWSPNKIESSTLLEPTMRIYNLTQNQKYLDFATYIVNEGGAKGYNLFQAALNNVDPYKMAGVYPKAYEMMSLFEGLVEYYRVTKEEKWKQAVLNLFHNIIEKEITIIGNGGGDQPYHPKVLGEAWDNTAVEQTNPDMERMMETCVGVTWMKLCSQLLRLTGDPLTVDMIEKYAYNGLLGAMKPEGDGFSYVNLLNGVKTNAEGWGGNVSGVYMTCCNLNGPMGLAYLPYVAVMKSNSGPVINLYEKGLASVDLSEENKVGFKIETDYPKSGNIAINVSPKITANFNLKLRIPAWSTATILKINGKEYPASAGTYADINRKWSTGDLIELQLDMRCRIIDAPQGSNRKGDHFKALVRGPIVLTRDENLDENYDKPINIISKNGLVEIIEKQPTYDHIKFQFKIPTESGHIDMIDYASANSWSGKKVFTWIPYEPEINN